MNIHAVSTTKPLNIDAALARPDVRAVARVLAKAGIERPTGKIDVTELSEKLVAAGVSPEKRIEIRIALERAGLIGE